ncbi:MAG: hypothetical protein KF768_09450 [Phycisphaeraceae bacterium]|nr:hypothetical protein [Phycisphaeraceae bacterium]
MLSTMRHLVWFHPPAPPAGTGLSEDPATNLPRPTEIPLNASTRPARRARFADPARHPLPLLASLALLFTLPACSNSTPRSTAAAAAVSVRTSRVGEPGRYINRFDAAAAPIVWARAGERLIVPVRPSPEQIAAGELVARLDKGRSLPAPLYFVWPDADPTVPAPARPPAARWLNGFPGVAPLADNSAWRSITADRAAELLRRTDDRSELARLFGTWVVVLDMPTDAAGQGLWLASRRVPIGWLLDPPYRPAQPDPEGLVPREAHARLLDTLEPALASPFLRWRARLTLRAAGYERWRSAGDMPDAVTERLARQIEDEWTFGLDVLFLTQPALERQLRDRLAGLIVLASTPEEPAARATVAWDPNLAGLDRLKAILLRANESPANRATLVTNWIESEPSLGAWVIDDAGLFDAASARPVATIGLLRLPGVAGAAASIELAAFGAPSDAGARGRTVLAMKPGELASLSLPVGVSPTPSRFGAPVDVGIGPWRTQRRVLDTTLQVQPPGLIIAPMLDDWSLASWWANATAHPEGPLPPIADAPFAAMLFRHAAASALPLSSRSSPPSPADADSWVLYIEADLPPATPATQTPDQVRIWIGQPYAPLATCTVFSDGRSQASGPAGPAMHAEVLRWSDSRTIPTTPVRTSSAQPPPAPTESNPAPTSRARWSAWIRIPASCLEPADPVRGTGPRQTLRLGIERTDPRGRRSAWPRPMTPWQSEPGRLRIDLSRWATPDRADALTRP